MSLYWSSNVASRITPLGDTTLHDKESLCENITQICHYAIWSIRVNHVKLTMLSQLFWIFQFSCLLCLEFLWFFFFLILNSGKKSVLSTCYFAQERIKIHNICLFLCKPHHHPACLLEKHEPCLSSFFCQTISGFFGKEMRTILRNWWIIWIWMENLFQLFLHRDIIWSQGKDLT